ncbi:KMT2E family protein [Megaselia abdita]
MPLQSGIIVVEKPPTVISTAGTPVSTTVVSQQQKINNSAPKTNQIYEYYETTQGVPSNSGSGTLNNIIRRQKKLSGSTIQHYEPNQHGSQVQILTEEYLEQTTTTPSGTVINITPNDLMNQPRFIKFVNADNTTNVIIDSSNGPQSANVGSNQSNGLPNSSHVNTTGTTSKVLVSNLTVLKQHQQNVAAGQPQHIGLINSKDLSYVTTSGKNIQKIVNIPVKTTVGGVQKVTIPRNVQVVTRIPTLDGSNQNSVSSGQQILVQPKYISHNVVAGNNNNLTLIKKQGGGALKIQTQKMNTGIKTTYYQTSQPQQPQTLYVQQTTTLTPTKVKSQKILKQFNNAINNNTSTVSVATLGGQKQQLQTGTTTTSAGSVGLTSLKKHPKYNLVQNQHYTTSNIVSTIPPGTKINTIMPSDHFNNASATGTIKFVNAQGNIIQQQSLPIQRSSTQPQSQVIKFSSPNKHLLENSQSEDGGGNIYKIGNFVQTSNANVVATAASATSKVTTVASNREEVMIVNGTQMTDEYSARILQQMAQKSYQQQQHVKKPVISTNMPPPQPVHQQVHQTNTTENKTYSIFSTPPKTTTRYVNKVNLERKDGVKKVLDSEYFRINSNEVKSTFTTTSVPVPSTLKPAVETTFVDNIPLPLALPVKTEIKPEPEDNIGEEIRPVPIDTIDVLQQRLYAVHQDHTYHSNSLSANDLHKLQASTIKTEKSSNSFILYGQNHQDDDANSVISNGSRTGALENDLGEETETAPEAEAEDDSVTRCICDFTHDDGYMICCDKCSCWQHVDCMGIDRQNIPEEYLCEMCQPRLVDKPRARNLQTVKRKEQQQLLLNTQFNNSNVGGNGSTGPSGPPSALYPAQSDGKVLLPSPHLGSAHSTSSLNSLVSPPPMGKKTPKLTKKKELFKKSKKEKIVGKKKENTKKVSKKKFRTSSVGDTPAEKHAANLRFWIENYEIATTNHYSPELRARLHAISKQSPLLSSNQKYNYLEQGVSIIPHAGGKILIANFEIQPNTPIIEMNGKFMLSTQYKNQNPSKNMNSPWPPTNYLQSLKYMFKIPGPFIFFYQWTMDSIVSDSNLNTVNGPEICVDTRTFGSDARFVRRSCRPNACLKHTFVNGVLHLSIVALTKIMASTEITIRHEPHDLQAIENKQSMALNNAYQNVSIQPTSTSCACGLIKECVFGVQTKTVKEEKSNKTTKKKFLQTMPSASNRNRSTSSSGESNSGVTVSPNILTSSSNINNSLTSLTTNVLHDSGVYTSSSSPSVSIPSPSQQLSTIQPQVPLPPVTPLPTLSVVESQSSSEIVAPAEPSPPLPPQQETIEDTQPEQLNSPQEPPPAQTVAPPKVARTPKKSVSESNDGIPQTDSKENSPSKAKTEEKRESRKLTRDERKLEAIVRAIEKMEKNQQKKQDSKYTKRATSGSPSPKRSKLNSSSESGGDFKIRKKKKTKNMQKSCGMPTKKSKSCKKNPIKKQFSGNDSDVFNTSEESLLSPIPPSHNQSSSSTHIDDEDNLNKAADLLLAFAKNDIKTEPSHEEHGNPSTPLSSNCLLVEAAVGPIDQDNFKLPISQAKTKKTMMNNWFNQNEYSLHIPCMDSPKSPGYDSPLVSPSLALKKVEEFITQADCIQPPTPQVTTVSPQVNNHPTTLSIQGGISTCANNSSVKKRWLRQAISEESEIVSDAMSTPTTPTIPTTPTPLTPNGFMTPLKKRRLLIDASPVDISHDIKDEMEDMQPLSPKVKTEEMEDVDIMRSPSPESKENNPVKIEPEDPPEVTDEMQVDVEQSDVDIESKEVKLEIKEETKEENHYEDILHSFHKENLLNLEARNREKKLLIDDQKLLKKEKREKKKIKKKKKSKFLDIEERNDRRKLSCSSTSSTLSSLSMISNEVPPPQTDVPTETTHSPLPPLEARAISSLPLYNTIYSKFNNSFMDHPVVQSPRPPSPIACSILTPDYLDAKLKSYNSLGGFVHQTTSSLLGGLSIEINGSQSPTSTTTISSAKPFTKTASHDPRLNPQLTAPEPAPTPKRKLSINEYRKRKQLSSESNTGNPNEALKSNEDLKCKFFLKFKCLKLFLLFVLYLEEISIYFSRKY